MHSGEFGHRVRLIAASSVSSVSDGAPKGLYLIIDTPPARGDWAVVSVNVVSPPNGLSIAAISPKTGRLSSALRALQVMWPAAMIPAYPSTERSLPWPSKLIPPDEPFRPGGAVSHYKRANIFFSAIIRARWTGDISGLRQRLTWREPLF